MLDINLLGVVHGCHYFLPAMIARGAGGHVVNVASMAAYTPNTQLCAYTTSKSPEAWVGYYLKLKRLSPPLVAWLARVSQRRLERGTRARR